MVGNLLIPKSVDSIIEKAIDKPAACIGDTIADIWFLVFGGIGQAAEKRRTKYAYELENFRKELTSKVNSIPDDKIAEPNLQIIAPALENAKYCIEEESLRSIFANLIAASLNSDTINLIHPSFSEIAKQLSPIDASNLECFKMKSHYPIVEYRYKLERGILKTIPGKFFLGNPGITNREQQCLSIECLARLGLIAIEDNVRVVPANEYDIFETTPDYQIIKAYMLTEKAKEIGIMDVVLIKGRAVLSEIGVRFLDVCMP